MAHEVSSDIADVAETVRLDRLVFAATRGEEEPPPGCWLIQLTRGFFAVIDDGDYDLVGLFRWNTYIGRGGKLLYANRNASHGNPEAKPNSPKSPHWSMHRMIIGAAPKQPVDHRNGNGLDNRRCNIRDATALTNARNRAMTHNKHGFKGVHKHSSTRFVAQITITRKNIYLGVFLTPGEAALAYDAAARRHFGEFARLNFPNSSSAGLAGQSEGESAGRQSRGDREIKVRGASRHVQEHERGLSPCRGRK